MSRFVEGRSTSDGPGVDTDADTIVGAMPDGHGCASSHEPSICGD
ncbi:hypothetical protein AKJ08_3133 [Vulgatibacter incomptus]|uniref:Uncharacterized protein n=1 Tax=Vulgatibacter incomptus TaxID=1391653 RepID=A0A0K1PH74_9BACT|nr:hypothetical protein AKJ08_3133 [Vulgatibacter incomptus]